MHGLKVFGAFVDPRQGEGVEEGAEDLENGRPGDPLGERFGVAPGQQEAPLARVDREVLFPSGLERANMTGLGEFVEDELDGAAEISSLAGDLSRVASTIGQKPGDDFGTGLPTKQGAEFEKEGGGVVGTGCLAHPAEVEWSALPAALQKDGIRFTQQRKVRKEGLGNLAFRGDGGVCTADEDLPLVMGGVPGEMLGDTGKNARVSKLLLFL